MFYVYLEKFPYNPFLMLLKSDDDKKKKFIEKKNCLKLVGVCYFCCCFSTFRENFKCCATGSFT